MEFTIFALSVAVIGFCLLFLPHLDRNNRWVRLSIIGVLSVFWMRYMTWRLFYTTLPIPMITGHGLWIWLCFFVEVLVSIESFIFYITLMRHTDRTSQADKFEKALRELSPEELPTVDVFLPTYNEGIEVIERSILGCLHLDWPKNKLKVWVLDDGKREWVRQFCEEVGAGYISRKEWVHAKAGNLNHAFEMTNGDFIAVFDADFVPFRNFLYRTVGFFVDPKVAILQTPQHFFNKDYVQSNLHLHDSAPDDQRLFFDVMMPARDGWDAAFWCGSCSLARRTAMREAGGVPTRSITEDLTTTLALLRHGYITRYLNEKLSHGLAPESLPSLLTQRKRWCRGTIQTMFMKDGPLGPGLRFIHRVLFFPWHWLISPFTRFFSFLVPIVFLWTGYPALLITHYSELIYYHFPAFLMNLFVTLWLAPRHYIPLLSSSVSSLEAIQVLPTVVSSLSTPFKNDFGVTPKGTLGRPAQKKNIFHFSFWICMTLLVLTSVGMLVNIIPERSPSSEGGFFPVAAVWATMNVFMLIVMSMISVEHPRPRTDERFQVDEEGYLQIEGKDIRIHIQDISLGGVSLHYLNPERQALSNGQEVTLTIPSLKPMPCEVVRTEEGTIHLRFKDLTGAPRHALIQHLYTGKYHNSSTLKYTHFARHLFHRIFSDHSHLYTPPTKAE
ncbi:MAG: glycosyltransferase [Alphaproteobacteria bacterium]|nr:glycosyltransferase [Alphaproteobacteria bacterium]